METFEEHYAAMQAGKSSLFYLWWNFTKEKSLCKNSGLDSRPDSGKYRPVGTMGKKFKKGVDFVLRRRYNVCCRIGRNESVMNLFLADDNKEVLKYKKEVLLAP